MAQSKSIRHVCLRRYRRRLRQFCAGNRFQIGEVVFGNRYPKELEYSPYGFRRRICKRKVGTRREGGIFETWILGQETSRKSYAVEKKLVWDTWGIQGSERISRVGIELSWAVRNSEGVMCICQEMNGRDVLRRRNFDYEFQWGKCRLLENNVHLTLSTKISDRLSTFWVLILSKTATMACC